MSKICNHDCFNCPYPDCINDDITLDEYREIAERDAEIIWLNSLKTDCERQSLIKARLWRKAHREQVLVSKKAYRKATKEQISLREKAYYEANKEHKNAYCKAWRKANREHMRAYEKVYREANKEQINARQRAYYAAKKLAKAANNETLTTTRQVQNGI